MQTQPNTNTEPTVVVGTYSGNHREGIIEWTCPLENVELRAWGQFNYDEAENVYTHDVLDQDGNLLYIVKA